MNLKKKSYIIVFSILGLTIIVLPANAMVDSNASQHKIDAQKALSSDDEIVYTEQLTDKINTLFDDVIKLIMDFVDDNNQEPYNIHIQKFANKIEELKKNILEPIDCKVSTAVRPFKDALLIARDIVQDMMNNVVTIHKVLVAHLPKKNAIDLKADLEPAIQYITSNKVIAQFDNKLMQLSNALARAGHFKTAKKIQDVRIVLKQAKASYDEQKVSPKMLAVLRNRLRRK
jgi:hypothetical protein